MYMTYMSYNFTEIAIIQKYLKIHKKKKIRMNSNIFKYLVFFYIKWILAGFE